MPALRVFLCRMETKKPLTDALVLEAIERLSLGESLRDACKELGLQETAVRMRIIRNPDLGDVYAKARESFADLMLDRLMDVAQDEPDVQRARLMCDNIKWAACKILPKKYGDKTHVFQSGPDGGPIQIQFASSQEARQALDDMARRLAVLNAGD